MGKEFCISHHDAKMCFLPNCRYHFFLLVIVEELLQKLNPMCFTHQQVDCVFTVFKYRFNRTFAIKSGQVFDVVQREIFFNQIGGGMDRMPSIPKKMISRIKYRKHLLTSFQKTKLTQTSKSLFAVRIGQLKKTKLELELIKFVDCFLDGYSSGSNLVTLVLGLYMITIL